MSTLLVTSVEAYASYFAGIRKRTLRMVSEIPPDRVDFTPNPGKFTFGDLIRHLGSTEEMFVRVVLEGRWTYGGHGRELGSTLVEAQTYLEAAHGRAMRSLQGASNEVLSRKCPTMHGHPVSGWHLLMAMVEHETHHRSQISQYLVALGLEPPQIFGLKIEQVAPEGAD